MASTPTTSSAATSTPPPSDAGSHRSCPACKKRMSTLRYDRHSLCFSCRVHKCDMNNRCEECSSWDDNTMSEYLKHRKSLDQKGGKKSSSSSNSSSNVSGSSSKEKEKEMKMMENRISSSLDAKLESFSKHLIELVSRSNQSSFSAPSQVPEMDHVRGRAGGDDNHKSINNGRLIGSSGAGLESNLDPHLINFNVHAANVDRADYVNKELILDRTLGRDIEWQGAQDEDRMQGRNSLVSNRFNIPNVSVVPPATFSPSDIIFPSVSSSQLLPPPPSLPLSSSSSLPPASSSSSFMASNIISMPPPLSSNVSPLLSAPPLSSSSSLAREDHNLLLHNAHILGISKVYVNLVMDYVNFGYKPEEFRLYVTGTWPTLADDMARDFQTGESVLMKSYLTMKQAVAVSMGSTRGGGAGVIYSSVSGAPVPPPVPSSSSFSLSSFPGAQASLPGPPSLLTPPPSQNSASSSWNSSQSFLSSHSSVHRPLLFPALSSNNPRVVPDPSSLSLPQVGISSSSSSSSSFSSSSVSSGSGLTSFPGSSASSQVLSDSLQTPFLSASSLLTGASVPPQSLSDYQRAVLGNLGEGNYRGMNTQGTSIGNRILNPISYATVSASSVRPSPGIASSAFSLPPSFPSGSDYPPPVGPSFIAPSYFQSRMPSSSSSVPTQYIPLGSQYVSNDEVESNISGEVEEDTDEGQDGSGNTGFLKKGEYKRMMNFITSMYPQALGEPSKPPRERAIFENIFSEPPPHTPATPSLVWFQRLISLMEESDEKLRKHILEGKFDSNLIPTRKPLYDVSGNPSRGRATLLNKSLEAHLERVPSLSRLLDINLREGAKLETALRNQMEALSHTMWVMSGFIGFLKRDGYTPSDKNLFDTMTYSLSAGLLDQAQVSSSLLNFVGLKRRQFFANLLPPYFAQVHKKSLLSSPMSSADSLFREVDIESMVLMAQTTHTLKSQQAVLDASLKRSASPDRRSSFKRKKSGSPLRSPKRVKFLDNSASSSSTSYDRSSPKRKNFRK